MTTIITLSLLLASIAAIIIYILYPAKKRDKTITLWYAVDADGVCCLYREKPVRDNVNRCWYPCHNDLDFIEIDYLRKYLPNMTWESDPVKIKLTIE